MDNTLDYFGTDLRSPGHYFWKLEQGRVNRSKIDFGQIPFNPEELPDGEKYDKGYTAFNKFGDYSVFSICGSPSDSRGGCKSVFWVKEDLTKEQLIERIKSNPAAVQLIEKMPFKVRW